MNIQFDFWSYWFVFCGMIMSSYFATALAVCWLFFPRKNHQADSARIISRTKAGDIKRSIISAICFGLVAACFMTAYNLGLTKVYLDWSLFDLGYIALSYAVVLILQDSYFYFSHRLLHLPWFFRRFHEGHHQSRPPTPWTFFALEPVEAFSQIGFLFVLTLIIPLNLGVLVAVLVTMTVWSTGNHLGRQVVPPTRSSRWWGRWLIGSSHHLIHHQKYSRHYGLYFTFWDRVLGTQDSAYESRWLKASKH